MGRTFFCARGLNSRWTNRPLLYGLLSFLMLSSLSGETLGEDSRRAVTGESSPRLRAIGKLQVPGQRLQGGYRTHYIEDCSATLVAPPGHREADVIVTAWHCLELYRDLSREIIFTTQTASGEVLERKAYPLADGGGMSADWAILRLRPAVPEAQLAAMQPHTALADARRPVTMAGYSRDEGLGAGGRVLTFDPDCAITGQNPDFGETDCTAFKGASGGAVIQFAGSGAPLLCGVISQGNGMGKSTYVPLVSFRKTLIRYLR